MNKNTPQKCEMCFYYLYIMFYKLKLRYIKRFLFITNFANKKRTSGPIIINCNGYAIMKFLIKIVK